jgi:hypothetical protein
MRVPGLLLLLVLTAIVAVGAWRVAADREAQRREAVETSLFRSWARAEAGAGISIVPKRVPPVPERTLRQLQELPGFHEFAMRCASCHLLPDPEAYETRRWGGVVERMRHHIHRSGTIPPPDAELEAALQFLRAASQQRPGD